ncbi:MAG TPA: ATP-binding protein [Bacillota bacterium]|nr:ATP-binding protein [Bacillota bacterium]
MNAWIKNNKTLIIYTFIIFTLIGLVFVIKHAVMTEKARVAANNVKKIDLVYYKFASSKSAKNEALDDSDHGWKAITAKTALYQPNSIVWIKLVLPITKHPLPYLYFETTESDFKVLTEGRTIGYQHRTVHSGRSCKRPVFIPLDPKSSSQMIYIRINPSRITSPARWANFKLGCQDALFHELLVENLEDFILAIIFIFIGICLLPTPLIGGKSYMAFACIGLFSFSTGMFTLGIKTISPFIWNIPTYLYYIGAFFFYLLPVGIIRFLNYLTDPGGKYKKIRTACNAVILLSILHTLCMVLLDAAGVVSVYATEDLFQVGFIMIIAFYVIFAIKVVKSNMIDVSIITVGSICAAVGGIHDMLYSVLGYLPCGYSIFEWGMLFFITSMILFMLKRFIAMHREVTELNQHLECRVLERTKALEAANQNLNELNEELNVAMTNLEETQLQLVQSEKMALLGNLIAGIAHEINSPLGTIKSNVEMETMLLKSEEAVAAEHCSDLFGQVASMNHINKLALDRIIALVKSLKNFARLDEADLKEANLQEGIESTLLILSNQLKTRIDVIKDFHEIPPVLCYPQQINQIFLNILLNAIQAIDGKGSITIATLYEGGSVKVRFSDTGSGIPPELLPKIFKSGFTTKDREHGTGLGLSICQAIIQKHKGRIAVESKVGQGTTFTVELPVG